MRCKVKSHLATNVGSKLHAHNSFVIHEGNRVFAGSCRTTFGTICTPVNIKCINLIKYVVSKKVLVVVLSSPNSFWHKSTSYCCSTTLMFIVMDRVHVSFVIIATAILATFAGSLPFWPTEVLQTEVVVKHTIILKIIATFIDFFPFGSSYVIDEEVHLVPFCIRIHGKPKRIAKPDSIELLAFSISSTSLITANTLGIIRKWVI
mmetsp:Transcript_27796/g.50375  ORF Transcript_27796/g.50375 Transcript_27796/m.50375 type:complete len:205 (+) Transcript_27796:1486-2100(+)